MVVTEEQVLVECDDVCQEMKQKASEVMSPELLHYTLTVFLESGVQGTDFAN